MSTYMAYAAELAEAFYGGLYLLLEYAYFPVHAELFVLPVGVVQRIVYLLENPRTAKGSSTHHNCIYPKIIKSSFTLFWGSNISITDNWDMYTRILFYFTN